MKNSERIVKLFFALVLSFACASLAHPIFPTDKQTKIISKGDYVFEVQKKFPQVLTKGEAKSKETLCYFKIDLLNSLISTGPCAIYKADAYTKDVMWLGTLTWQATGNTYFEPRSNYQNTSFGGLSSFVMPNSIWGINTEFVEPTEIADSSNISAVSCPSGKKPIIVNDELDPSLFYWDCYIPWKCKKGEYSIDEHTCEILPENARRNSKEGFSCNKGFVPVEKKCEEKRTCDENEHYDELSNACWVLPQMAKWADSVLTKNDFVCDSGYFKNTQYSTCDVKLTCEGSEHYDIRTNKCWGLPRNAVWKDRVLKPNDWTCLEGYVKIQGVDDDICVKKKKCNSRDIYQVESNSCWILPRNAKWNTNVFSEEDWSCVLGYEKRGNICQKKVVCSNREILLENGKCEEIPQNSHKVDSKTWQCDAGYNKVLGNNKSYCEERKTKSTSIPTEWIATGASILLGLIVLLVMN